MTSTEAIIFLAKENHTTPEEIRNAIQNAIDIAKDYQRFKELFGETTPTVDDFLEKYLMMFEIPKGPAQ